jgi:hypothetical protein
MTTHCRPFYDKNQWGIVYLVLHCQIRPDRPDTASQKVLLADSVWELVNMCWRGRGDRRPPMEEIADIFATLRTRQPIDTSESLDSLVQSMHNRPAKIIGEPCLLD